MREPKILFYDLETAPNLAEIWGHYEQNALRHVREWYIMCFSYKWAGQKKTHVVAQPDFKDFYSKHPDSDLMVVEKLWKLFDEADLVIAHNGDRFDMRKANARFVYHRLGPPTPVKSVDTLKEARRHFMFNSNKLGDLGEHLGLGKKAPTGGYGELWVKCMHGDAKAWRNMKRYAKQDVVLLEQVYLTLRPWMKSHPSLAILSGIVDACPRCNESGKMIRRGPRTTDVTTWQQWQCTACGSYSRSRLSESIDDVSKPNFV